MSSVVVFLVGVEWLALPTSVFKEVTEMRAIHSLPYRRGGIMLGIVNVRGELLICVSLAKLLGLDETVPAARGSTRTVTRHASRDSVARLLVIGRDDRPIVIPVGAVHGIHRYRPSDLGKAPGTIGKSASAYTAAMLRWRERAVAYLDAEKLLSAVDRGIT